LSPAHASKDAGTSDGDVSALLQSLINEFKGLRAGLEGQSTVSVARASNKEARATTAIPPGVSGAARAMGQGSTPALAVLVEDEEGTVTQPMMMEKQKKRKKNRVIYGVARGRKTGMFHRWNDVIRAVQGYSGAMHKRFRTEEAATAWLSSKGVAGFGDDDSESGDTCATCQEESDIPPVVGGPPPATDSSKPRTSLPLDQIVDLKTVGPDPSVGKPTEIYGQSIQVEPEVLKLLCPKGVTAPVRKEIMEASIDVVSLPGKFTTAGTTVDGSNIMDQFAEALGDMTDVNARRGSSLPRDTQWRMPTRNALDKLLTVEDLNLASEELTGQFDNVTNNMESAIKEILYNAGWTPEDAESFCVSGLLPRIIRSSLLAFMELHMHFQILAIQHPAHWDEVGKEHVMHHARALGRIRRFALTRSQLVLQVYVYLRDQKSKNFMDIKLLGSLTMKWHGLTLNRLPPGGGNATPQWTCAHCHSSLHQGGAKKCPFGEFKVKAARRLALETQRLMATEPGVLERLLAEERAKKEDENS
jgi:hypothetical protein